MNANFLQAPRRGDVHINMTKHIETLGSLFVAGRATELNYLSADAQAAALALETELLADAAAGVDLRIRLIGAAVSK